MAASFKSFLANMIKSKQVKKFGKVKMGQAEKI
jgi:hypothetical protein